MLFTRALIACGLLAMMILPSEAENNTKKSSSEALSIKELSKKRKEERSKEAKSEKSIEKANKAAEKEAEQAQARERSLPKHEDHHKLGTSDRVDKGFDFGTSNSK